MDRLEAHLAGLATQLLVRLLFLRLLDTLDRTFSSQFLAQLCQLGLLLLLGQGFDLFSRLLELVMTTLFGVEIGQCSVFEDLAAVRALDRL